MRTEHLYYFKRLVEVRNFTQTAKLLFISQPTLSSAVKSLEKEVGVPLLTRSKGSHVTLTKSGEVFYDQVVLSLNSLENGFMLAQEAHGAKRSTIKIGSLFAMQGRSWATAVNLFRQELQSDLLLETRYGYSQDMLSQLRDGSLDVAFCSRLPGDQDMEHVYCMSLPLVLAVHKNNLLANRSEVSLDELFDQRIVTYSYDSSVSPSLEQLIEGRNLQVERSYMDDLCMCSYIEANDRYAALFCYSFLCEAYQNLVFIPVREAPLDFHPIYMTYPKKTTKTAILNKFVSFLTEHFASDNFR